MFRWLLQAFLLAILATALGVLTWLLHPGAPRYEQDRLSRGEVVLETVILTGTRPIVWLDARPRAAFEAAHVSGAVHLDESDWDGSLAALMDVWEPRNNPLVIVYCNEAACTTSRELADRLRRDLDYEDVFFLRGGWAAFEPYPQLLWRAPNP